ncbi:Amino-acid carrier protein alsT [Pseudorhizobium banfieldiae]|uniref:Amino-acid carrier protein alsT n=1 Tax=Pseudorhizobium banfieldiae TaxID=1125847 RepID=L0NFP7_9HYPH|nr:sodium:alanine symporter family protein [Pseudorhizobium banfieldiae]CAD6610839.1 alanine:cation symporter family protein [arsenite-oxidising bacterium NT-25]CAD6616410.1 alanine:cation symporter family protein [Rhizobium sp. TCK]CCF19694.1 Amino-acid carrier protein alsT [Pseudorhizobium banfieldiae]
MTALIDLLNLILWEYVLVYGLLAVGLYFTIRLRLIQFLHFGEMFRVLRSSPTEDDAGISPFQALTVSLASRVGTGNIAGVAVALYLGGPGAIFWMWMVALVGMATAYSESALAQLYKVKNEEGMYRGGPAFYIARGLRAPWAGGIFSICLILSFGLVFNAVQANSIADAMEGAFGLPKLGVGVVVAVLAGIVIFGGIRQIARVAELIVPFMAGAYLLAAIYVLITNWSDVPAVIGNIFASAFGWQEAAGGATGGIMAAMMNGVKRGLFSNEAGMGSAPNIAAVATPQPHHPSSQGFVQALGVFIDTLLVCTATAIMILLSGALVPESGVTGAQLTQAALEEHLGTFGAYFIAIAIFFFAFTSIIGNYSYAENAMTFLGAGTGIGIVILRSAVLLMVVWGAYETVTTVFNAADASMGLMATSNLIAIVLLSGTVAKLTKDYFAQRKAGESPVFHAADYPELAGKIDKTIWTRD